MIDKINSLYANFFREQNHCKFESFCTTFNELMQFIYDGNYTNRRNKTVILKNWNKLNNRELAELLGISVSSISYAKRDICHDLVNSLGYSIISYIENNNFLEISNILATEKYFLNLQILFPETIIHDINQTYTNDIKNLNSSQNSISRETEEMLKKSNFKLYNFPKELKQSLVFLQNYFLPKAISILCTYDINNEVTKDIIDILNKRKGTAEDRHAILNYFLDSTSTLEEEIYRYDVEKRKLRE